MSIELTTQLFELCIIPLFAVLTGYAVQFIRVKTAELKGKTKNETAKKYGIPPKKLAKNFFEKVLGTIGDVLGIAISAVDNAAHMVVNILSTVVHGAVNIVVGVANALASIVTLNKTCIA